MSDEQDLAWMREFKNRDAGELMQRYGAHSLGIGRLIPGDSDDQRMALLFYLDPDGPELGAAEPVPAELDYVPSGRSRPVSLPTRVVEAPRAEFE